MRSDSAHILRSLREVRSQRLMHVASPELLRAVTAVKVFQQQRFKRTYADLLADTAYAAVVQFFLDELYGPDDFSSRDAQFERVVPSLVRLFPSQVVGTVRSLAELHALSEYLDTRMGVAIAEHGLTPHRYMLAWAKVGDADLREKQVQLTVSVGKSLTRYTRNPLLRGALRAMRGPAKVAGLSELQDFLEKGFDTFRALPDPDWFLAVILERESRAIDGLFSGTLPS